MVLPLILTLVADEALMMPLSTPVVAVTSNINRIVADGYCVRGSHVPPIPLSIPLTADVVAPP